MHTQIHLCLSMNESIWGAVWEKISKERVRRVDVVKIHDIVEDVFTKPIAVGDERMPVKQIKSILLCLILICSLIMLFFVCF